MNEKVIFFFSFQQVKIRVNWTVGLWHSASMLYSTKRWWTGRDVGQMTAPACASPDRARYCTQTTETFFFLFERHLFENAIRVRDDARLLAFSLTHVTFKWRSCHDREISFSRQHLLHKKKETDRSGKNGVRAGRKMKSWNINGHAHVFMRFDWLAWYKVNWISK